MNPFMCGVSETRNKIPFFGGHAMEHKIHDWKRYQFKERKKIIGANASI